MLIDKFGNAEITHYGSWKCHRVTRSVLAAEIHAFSNFLDFLLVLAGEISRMLNRKIKMLTFTDSIRLFDTKTKLTSVSEKRLFMKIVLYGEVYSCRAYKCCACLLEKQYCKRIYEGRS